MKALHVKLNEITQALHIPCSFNVSKESLWAEIDEKETLLQLSEILETMNARVCMITCYTKEDAHEIVYHFDLNGIMLNLKLAITDKSVPSITPFFKSADWTEREMSELYGIALLNHPNPKRLFLDESIKESVVKEYFSLSTAMSGKVSEELWNKVKASQEVRHG